MKFRVMLLILIPTLALSVAALAWPEQGEGDSEREARIALTDAPKAVQEAVLKVTDAASITEVDKVTVAGIAVYDVEYKRDGLKHSITFAAAGDVIEKEEGIDASKLPAAVRSALLKKFQGAEIVRAESITLHSYDVTVMVDGKRRKVALFASGHIEDDDDEDDDDEEDDDDDDDDDEDEEDEDDEEDDD